MRKIPITLKIDDPTPVVSVYYSHAKSRTTKDGRELVKYYPNSMLFDFCDIIEKHGIKGKFSVVPAPGNYGDIVNGIEGVEKKDMDEWLCTVKSRVTKYFDICPEMLTHNKAVDLESGRVLDETEHEWSQKQNEKVFTPYIKKSLSILKEAGFDVTGITSPWAFGLAVEDEYVKAISQAMYDVYGRKNVWYFLRSLRNVPNAKPWVALDEGDRCVVSVPATTDDCIWQTIESPDTSDEYVSAVTDELITADGKHGQIIDVINTGGYPIIITHWQSLASNGLFTGLRVLDEMARRINTHLSDKVEWMKVSKIMDLVIADKKSYPKR